MAASSAESNPDQEAIRVMLAARYPSARAGLRAMLQSAASSAVEVVADAPLTGMDQDDLAALVERARPDVLIVDAATDGWNNEELAAGLVDALRRAGRSDVGVVVLAGSGESAETIAVSAFLALPGAPGWAMLSQNCEADALLAAVHAVAMGLVVLAPAFAALVIRSAAPANRPASEGSSDLLTMDGGSIDEPPMLTPREREVLQLMARGLPNKQIAQRLGISLHTAKFHVAQILARLDAATRAEAVAIGIRRGDVTA